MLTTPEVGQQSEALEQKNSSLVAHGHRKRRRKFRRVRWRWHKKWVCFRRPIFTYRHERKIVKFKRYCR